MISKLIRPLAACAAGLAAVAGALAMNAPPAASKAVPTPAEPAPAVKVVAKDANPAVAPGLVPWHPSFAAAQEAAKASGKPVLLLHMMGRLDRQFC